MVTRTSIQEANRHLHAMHQRISALETTVQHQNQTLLERDGVFQHQINELTLSKEDEILKLKNNVQTLQMSLNTKNLEVQDLQQQVDHKDLKIKMLTDAVHMAQSLAQHIPNLHAVIQTIESLKSSNVQDNGLQFSAEKSRLIESNYNLHENDENISSMARHYSGTNRNRNFSISEEDEEDIPVTQINHPNMMNGQIGGESNSNKTSTEFYL